MFQAENLLLHDTFSWQSCLYIMQMPAVLSLDMDGCHDGIKEMTVVLLSVLF